MINGVPRILIVRMSAIGDVVRVIPALYSLRHAFPHAQIDWAVESQAAEVLTGHPEIDRVLVFDRRKDRGMHSAGNFMAFCKEVRAAKYDIVLDFHGILKSGAIARYSGAKKRYGFASPRSREGSHLFTNQKVNLGKDVLNRVEENLRLADALAPRTGSPDVTLYVPDDVKDDIEEFFEASFDGNKLVAALHVPVDRAEKQWPLEHFAALSDMLQADGRFDVVLTWGPGQQKAVEQVVRLTRRNPVVAPELGDLKHYIWLIYCADLYFGCDTGPMHLATVMGTPVVAVFGGTDPVRHSPWRKPYAVLTAESCGETATGLTGAEKLARISPEAAYDACVRLAARRISVAS